MGDITRDTSSQTATIAIDTALSGIIVMANEAGMMIYMPAEWTTASLGFKVCDTRTGTFLPLYDKDNALVQISGAAASRAYAAPAELYTAKFVKLWSQNGSGTDTNQAAARAIGVGVKS